MITTLKADSNARFVMFNNKSSFKLCIIHKKKNFLNFPDRFEIFLRTYLQRHRYTETGLKKL